MLSLQRPLLRADNGYDVPQDLIEAGLADDYRRALDQASDLFARMSRGFPFESQYLVCHANRIRWQMTLNAREAGVLCELRSQPQGHADYRRVAQSIAKEILRVHPLLAPAFSFVDYDDHALGRLAQEEKSCKQGSR